MVIIVAPSWLKIMPRRLSSLTVSRQDNAFARAVMAAVSSTGSKETPPVLFGSAYEGSVCLYGTDEAAASLFSQLALNDRIETGVAEFYGVRDR